MARWEWTPLPRCPVAPGPQGLWENWLGAKPGSCGLALEMVRRCFAVARYEESACLIAEWLGISLARRRQFHQSTSSGGNPGDSRDAGLARTTRRVSGTEYAEDNNGHSSVASCTWEFGTKEEPLGVRGSSSLWKSYLESVSSELR